MFSKIRSRLRVEFFRILIKFTLRLVMVISIREFGALNEAAVEDILAHWKKSLGFAYQCRDQARINLSQGASAYAPDGADPIDYWTSQWQESNLRISKRQKSYDFARGLAYLMGFGKIADKISR